MWRDPSAGRPRPPATADIIVLDAWPDRGRRFWSAADIADLSSRFPTLAAVPLLDALVRLSEGNRFVESFELYAALTAGADIPGELEDWEGRRREQALIPRTTKLVS